MVKKGLVFEKLRPKKKGGGGEGLFLKRKGSFALKLGKGLGGKKKCRGNAEANVKRQDAPKENQSPLMGKKFGRGRENGRDGNKTLTSNLRIEVPTVLGTYGGRNFNHLGIHKSSRFGQSAR